MTWHIRAYHSDDAEALYAIYFKAVREGTKAHYTAAQRRAWAPNATTPPKWPETLAQFDTLVAEDSGTLLGFMATTRDGYIDLAFVNPDWMGRGVAQTLYDHTLATARARSLPLLTAHASHLARPFFARNGWKIDATETVERNGETLERFAMSLPLT